MDALDELLTPLGRAAAAEIVGEAESWRLVRERPAAIAATNVAFAQAA